MLLVRRILPLLLLATLLPGLALAQSGSEAEPPPIMMEWAEPPPVLWLEDRSLVGLSPLRSGRHGIRIRMEEHVRRTGPMRVTFRAMAMRNGERMAERSRTMIIWPSGDQVTCVDAWDVMPMLFSASEEGRLPEGDYEISLGIASMRGEPLAEPASFRFAAR